MKNSSETQELQKNLSNKVGDVTGNLKELMKLF